MRAGLEFNPGVEKAAASARSREQGSLSRENVGWRTGGLVTVLGLVLGVACLPKPDVRNPTAGGVGPGSNGGAVGTGTGGGASAGSTGSGGALDSAVIGPAGGSVSTVDGASVVIPPGALSTAITVSITLESSAAVPVGVTPVGGIYQMGPEGTVFAQPITVTLPYDPTQLPAGATTQDLAVVSWPDGATDFSTFGTKAVDATHLEAQTNHFTSFTVTTISKITPGVACVADGVNIHCTSTQVCCPATADLVAGCEALNNAGNCGGCSATCTDEESCIQSPSPHCSATCTILRQELLSTEPGVRGEQRLRLDVVQVRPDRVRKQLLYTPLYLHQRRLQLPREQSGVRPNLLRGESNLRQRGLPDLPLGPHLSACHRHGRLLPPGSTLREQPERQRTTCGCDPGYMFCPSSTPPGCWTNSCP